MKNKILILSCSFLLSGCLGHQTGTVDLRSFIADEKSKAPPPIKPVPDFEIIPQYQYKHGKDPFSVEEDEMIASGGPAVDTLGTIPDDVRNHPREELEEFSLDSLSMQGTLELKGVRWVLMQDPDGTLHRIRTGNYMGQNMGKIMRVSEEKVVLVEYYKGQHGYEPREAEIILEGL